MPLFVNLQRLSFNSIDFLTYEILSLSEVSRVGNLPCVTDLSFTNCKFLQTKLSLLFSSPWSRLTHLGLCKCGLNVEDYEMIGNIQDDRLPKLLSLSIDDEFSVMHTLAKVTYASKLLFPFGRRQFEETIYSIYYIRVFTWLSRIFGTPKLC